MNVIFPCFGSPPKPAAQTSKSPKLRARTPAPALLARRHCKANGGCSPRALPKKQRLPAVTPSLCFRILAQNIQPCHQMAAVWATKPHIPTNLTEVNRKLIASNAQESPKSHTRRTATLRIHGTQVMDVKEAKKTLRNLDFKIKKQENF